VNRIEKLKSSVTTTMVTLIW